MSSVLQYPITQPPAQVSLDLLAHLRQALPEQRKALLNNAIRKLLVDFLELDAIDDVAEDQNFADLGADSMQAVDFKVILETSLQCSLRSTVMFDFPQLDALTTFLLDEVLQLPDPSTGRQNEDHQVPSNPPAEHTDVMAIVAMAGLFPGAETAEALWEKALSGQPLAKEALIDHDALSYAGIRTDLLKPLDVLGLSDKDLQCMDRPQRLMCHVIADALRTYGLSGQSLTGLTTGLFVGAQTLNDNAEQAYQIPIANSLSFLLNLKGPSEVTNTFCTSAYVALHRAVQSVARGECAQALVGAVNCIVPEQFKHAAAAGWYKDILSSDHQTRSFSAEAKGYVRSEGVGVVLIKPLSRALQDGNRILAVINSTAVYHGGRGYSFEAPNPLGLKEAIKRSFSQAGWSSDSVDYIEVHGIGNVMADALELSAIHHVYHAKSAQTGKQWYVSCIKPSIGHPEMASGIAALIKVIKAFEHQTIPGIAGLGTLSQELPEDPALVLSSQSHPWPKTLYPRRAALNSYAIGGMNAHMLLEEYAPELQAQQTERVAQAQPVHAVNTAETLLGKDYPVVADLVDSVFHLDLAALDTANSFVDYGFDSIKVMQFVTLLNEQLHTRIKISQVLGVDNVAEFLLLLTQQQQQTSAQPDVTPDSVTIKDAELQPHSPLSEVQKGLWVVQQLAPDNIGYNIPMAFRVSGQINADALQCALRAMLQQYPQLRTAFTQDDASEELLQVVRPVDACVQWHVMSLAPEQNLHTVLFELLLQPFNLQTDPLVRLYLITTGEAQSVVFFVIHHLVFDGTSGALFIPEFWRTYHRVLSGASLANKVPEQAFFDFVRWEQRYLASEHAAEDLAWWRSQLNEQATTINLPYDRLAQSPIEGLAIGHQKFILPESRLNALKQLASRIKVNLSVVMLSAFQLFLYKLTQECSLAVTTPVRGRPKPEYENSIGCYINVMVTRCELSPELTFSELVQQTRQQFFNSLDHALYPFPKLLAALGLSMTNPNEIPFPVSYTYQNFFDELLLNNDALQGVEPFYDIYQQAEDNYTLEIYDFRNALQINIKYKRSVFDDSTIVRHITYFEQLLEDLVANPTRPLKSYTLLASVEQQLLLAEHQGETKAYPQDRCLHDLINAQAGRTPDHLAVCYAEEHLTYRQLQQQSQQLALYLQQQGVVPDCIVALCLPRSLDMIVALLGILSAGGAYLPIDASTPVARIKTLVQDSGAPLLITRQELANDLNSLSEIPCRMICMDTDRSSIDKAQGELTRQVTPQHLAYVIYTSGSTGQPKGVMIEHRSVINHNTAVIDAYRLTAADRVLQFSTISFDIFVEEVFPTLLSGGAVILLDGTRYTDPAYLKAILKQHGVTLINLPTAYWHTLAGEHFSDTALSRVIIGGEKAEIDRFHTWQQHNPGIQVINTYGPTETTVIALLHPIAPDQAVDRPIPLGKPLANTDLYILDPQLNLVPVGIPGELHIAGAGLARGYLNSPDLTREKFIDNPYAPGTRLYKTGDMARWLPNGLVEFGGRRDDQVKIRGFRVELGEIERVLLHYPAISNAVVVAQSQASGKQLVAFYQAEYSTEQAAISEYLRKHLPDYMVPAALVQLDEIPLNTHGKVDRAKLLAHTVELVNTTPYVAPTTAVEQLLVEIWQDVLGIACIGIQDNFFALGGHSLLAVQIVTRTNKNLSVSLSLSTLFSAPTIAALAVNLANMPQGTAEGSITAFIKHTEELLF